jgi:hypothetical protein
MWKEEIPEPRPVEPDHVFQVGRAASDRVRVIVTAPKHDIDDKRLALCSIDFSHWVPSDLDAAKLESLIAFEAFVVAQLAVLRAAIASEAR